jgi:hypothetical protein
MEGPPDPDQLHREVRRRGFSERYVAGSFQVRIPVTTESVMLPFELDRLAFVKARLAAMPVTDGWHPVLARYLKILEGRVQALGGDPEQVPGSYEGYPAGHECQRPHRGDDGDGADEPGRKHDHGCSDDCCHDQCCREHGSCHGCCACHGHRDEHHGCHHGHHGHHHGHAHGDDHGHGGRHC